MAPHCQQQEQQQQKQHIITISIISLKFIYNNDGQLNF